MYTPKAILASYRYLIYSNLLGIAIKSDHFMDSKSPSAGSERESFGEWQNVNPDILSVNYTNLQKIGIKTKKSRVKRNKHNKTEVKVDERKLPNLQM